MESEVNRRALYQRAYAIKKHHATRLHYDLRLEWNGVLLSWALPQGPNCRAVVLREAIEMEDHRVANLLFEGVHETGPLCCGIAEPGNHTRNSKISKAACARASCDLR